MIGSQGKLPHLYGLIKRHPITSRRVTKSEAVSSSSSSAKSRSLQDLRTPLLVTDEPHEMHQQNREEISDSVSVSSRSLTESERQSDVGDDYDSGPKKTGRRARLINLTKKMGEKFEEKKRHIEERGRHFVEKMRGPLRPIETSNSSFFVCGYCHALIQLLLFINTNV
ncbi:uncharacterized protein LOC120131520 [Hibiscus syriacus]|uniref:uncharacterized protein LOC120131520 n=1 Tax=Hibiscus syriacus TaxID=106335 RepID=UPI001922EC66|nr:uncharacterized protein LOC120131520 [Hibiscus syriacus]